jgi:hypothetical protein
MIPEHFRIWTEHAVRYRHEGLGHVKKPKGVCTHFSVPWNCLEYIGAPLKCRKWSLY